MTAFLRMFILLGAAFSVSSVSADEIASQIDKWSADFLPVCQAAAHEKFNSTQAAQYCRCVIAKHKQYITSKIAAGERLNVKEHLSELLDVYKPSSDNVEADDGRPSMTDLDMDLSSPCIPKKSTKRK